MAVSSCTAMYKIVTSSYVLLSIQEVYQIARGLEDLKLMDHHLPVASPHLITANKSKDPAAGQLR